METLQILELTYKRWQYRMRRKYLLASLLDTTRAKLKALQNEVDNSSSDVLRYLNISWIGVYELIDDCDGDMADLMDLWQEFHSFLLQLQHFFLKLKKFLALLEKISYFFLVYFSFFEFPNRLRPPCTTMPWTIWPALVVLLGVCWMFWEEPVCSWEGQDDFTASNTAGQFEGNNATGLSSVSDSNLDDTIYDIPSGSEPHLDTLFPSDLFPFGPLPFDLLPVDLLPFELPPFDPQLPQFVSEFATTSETATTVTSVPPLSRVITADAVNTPDSDYGNPNRNTGNLTFSPSQATSNIQEAADKSVALAAPNNSFTVHRQAQDNQAASSRNSKHGGAEKYFCTYSDCSRSQPGLGFCRKDHLDQHLRWTHKHTSVPRLRAKTTAISTPRNPTGTNVTTGAISQSQKRKRGNEGEDGRQNGDELIEELAEERRLRTLAEQENRQLREKLDNYEGRMQKYEERLDRMMTLFGERKGE